FFKLCKFLCQVPGIMIFVFDGPNRPSFKHGRFIDMQTELEWSNNCKTIIEVFGFYWHQAPREAEAELVMLSCYDAINIVITNDSDALVFGAQCVMKPIAGSNGSRYLLFSMDAVENTVSLSRAGLLLIALLSKSDYSDGLLGCGPGISASLARCSFGKQILWAVERLEDFKLLRELESISSDIQAELRSNSRNLLNSCYPQLASKFGIDI
ncbi:PIN domain-like protein, partial [Pholiota molesta]